MSDSLTAAIVDASGIRAPTFATIQQHLKADFRSIYGNDIVLDDDSQDGQLIGILALALADTNAMAVAVYNSFSPATAQGVGLSSNVKINGLVRNTPSNSTAMLVLIGSAGTVILNGAALDPASNRWMLPRSVTIPTSGQISVIATCATPGAVIALPGTINRIGTVTLGWQTVINPDAATVGEAVETDAALRVRQAYSTALPSLTVLEGIVGAILAITDVRACKPYENDTGVLDPVTTLPPHSIGLVVRGGDPVTICRTLLRKKTPGCFTAGTERHMVDDAFGLPHDVGYYIPAEIRIGVTIAMTARAGYIATTASLVQAAVADYINELGSGVDVIYSKLFLPANLCGADGTPAGLTNTYDITALEVGPAGGPYGTANMPIAIFEIALCLISDVVITVT